MSTFYLKPACYIDFHQAPKFHTKEETPDLDPLRINENDSSNPLFLIPYQQEDYDDECPLWLKPEEERKQYFLDRLGYHCATFGASGFLVDIQFARNEGLLLVDSEGYYCLEPTDFITVTETREQYIERRLYLKRMETSLYRKRETVC